MLAVSAALSLALMLAPPTDDAPLISGPASIGGLADDASASLDAFGIPTVRAATFADALRVQGFLHARDRFAQMDLLRRLTAGELCEIAGGLALAQDQQQRVMQLRRVARAAYEALQRDERDLLDAYAEGVNAGIAALKAPPPEHAFLRAPLAPWLPEDSLLVALGMMAMLNDSARIELTWSDVVEALPSELIEFFSARRSRWDAPVIPDTKESLAIAATPIPGPTTVDVRLLRAALEREKTALPATPPTSGGAVPSSPDGHSSRHEGDSPSFAVAAWLPPTADSDRLPIGSNGWVVAGALTRDGRAILVNDMHLPITVPGIWYRMAFRYRDEATGVKVDNASDNERALDGITLPGVPGMISGSNGEVAWGFTNIEGDFIDFVVVEPDPRDSSKYLVPGGSEAFRVEHEEIRIANAPSQSIDVRLTRWGPVVASDSKQRPLALVWAAIQPHGLNLDLLRLRNARSTKEALSIAAAWRGPQQNVMIADRSGQIGWTMSGYLPQRMGMDGTVPTSWADGTRGWKGEAAESDRPLVLNPASGIIVTANQRTVDFSHAASFGQLWAPPDRAFRIRERALADAPLDERTCSAVQLDVRSPRLLAWRDAILPALEAGSKAAEPQSADPSAVDREKRCAALAKVLRGWNGEVTADSKAVAIVDRTRGRVTSVIAKAAIESVLLRAKPDLAPAERSSLATRLAQGWPDDEAVLDVVRARPEHLLPPSADSWDQLLQDTALRVANDIRTKDGLPRWGQVNASNFAHPLARAIPMLASTFSIPTHEQAGHWSTVRVATPMFGASDRLVVSPSHEADGSLTTPAGQSANPSSPHYGDLHAAWRDGVFAPLLPGAPVERLLFTPTPTPDGVR